MNKQEIYENMRLAAGMIKRCASDPDMPIDWDVVNALDTQELRSALVGAITIAAGAAQLEMDTLGGPGPVVLYVTSFLREGLDDSAK